MKTLNYFQSMMAIYEHLLDEESKKVFDERIAYMLDYSNGNCKRHV